MGENKPLRLTRRDFLFGAAALVGGYAVAPWRRWGRALGLVPPEITGSIVGASHKIGHLLRAGVFPAPTATSRSTIVIVGGGISGLSAGWKLLRSGFKDFIILDLEEQFGGNSRWGQNAVSAYPWGAHYVPFPSADSRAVSELFRELGVEVGRDGRGHPIYDDRYVCFAPAERIYIHGRWQEGLFPRVGASPEDLRQYQSFNAAMAAYRHMRDSEGRRAFAIPMERSSRRKDLLDLDRISMAEFLKRNAWDSSRLRWFVEYCCRDDFGTSLADTSAWAGIHYFASRGEGPGDQVLTWPEGNGWLVRRLTDILKDHLRPSSLAFNVDQNSSGVSVEHLDARTGTATRTQGRAAIVCLPHFVAERTVPVLKQQRSSDLAAFQYSPWMVANLTVENPPSGTGAAPAWDNVLYGSESLGYVSATHQSLSQDRRASVWTYYRPFPSGDTHVNRQWAYQQSWETWVDLILKDLTRAHPDIRPHVRNIDVMVWGHGMIQPRVGFLWGGQRQNTSRPIGNIFFGHSDLSGFSIFEEAQYRGVHAAESVLASLGHPYHSSL